MATSTRSILPPRCLEYERREQERLSPLDYFAFHAVELRHRLGRGQSADEGLRVQGVEGLLTNLGKCCNPVPGDAIVGYVTKGRGVTIHRSQLSQHEPNVMPGQRPAARSDMDCDQAGTHVSGQDPGQRLRPLGPGARCGGLVADEHVNMRNIEAVTGQKDNLAVITATLEIQDIAQLTRIMTKIDRLPNIQEVRRKLAERCPQILAKGCGEENLIDGKGPALAPVPCCGELTNAVRMVDRDPAQSPRSLSAALAARLPAASHQPARLAAPRL